MISIYLIEDDPVFTASIKTIISDYFEDKTNSYEKKCISTDSIDFVRDINPSSINIYFVDIILKSDTNGIQLAKTIRDHDKNGYIIFITGYLEFALKVFKASLYNQIELIKNP